MQKKCLLISPPNINRLFPRGLVEIASFLEAKGCSTEVLPLAYYMMTYQGTLLHRVLPFYSGYSSNSRKIKKDPDVEKQITLILKKAIRRTSPIVIGISNQFTKHYPDCLKILEICKRINRKITTVIGGPHVTFLDIDCLKLPFVDVVVRGEGEWTMLDLLSAIEKKKDLENVKGISFKKDGKVLRTPERPLGNLNELPPTNFGLLPHKFVQEAGIYGILNRGCVYNCKFCAERVFWKKRRHFHTQRFIGEMRTLELKYNTTMHALDDSMVDMGSPQFFELCSELVKQSISIPSFFYTQCRVDMLTDQGIKALKEANIKRLWLGIESASLKVLKMMNKHITIKQIIEACKRLRDNKIYVGAFWIIGHPGDNPKEAAYSLEMLDYLFNKDLINEVEIALFLPYPGTPFFEQPQKYGVEILSFDWNKWESWCDKPVCQLKDFSAEEISLFYRESHQRTMRYKEKSLH